MMTHEYSAQEQILNPLRELYRRDFDHRQKIAHCANNFKLRGFFFRSEIDFLQERLSFHNIDFDTNLLPSKLLTIELVPSRCWFSNVRSNVSKKTWDFLRKSTYQKANYKCEICDGRGEKWPVECHEIWDYDDINHVQTLLSLIALCPSCHRVKHIGLAQIQGLGDKAKAHLARINNWSTEKTDSYLDKVWETWEERSYHDWTLDISFLNQYDIHLKYPIVTDILQ